MDTPMLIELRNHLANITAEQFHAEWEEIESMGFMGMPVEDFLKTCNLKPAISLINGNENLFSEYNKEYQFGEDGNNTTPLAA